MEKFEAEQLFDGPARIIVMGVAGCGKSSVAQALARSLGAACRDGDSYHPAENIAKMGQGVPLTDQDRWPWLDAVGRVMRQAPGPMVMACSALRRAYRERLSDAVGAPVFFAFLDGSFELIHGRMAAREGHFMPESLLQSQFETLERPEADEWALSVDISGDISASVAQITAHLARTG